MIYLLTAIGLSPGGSTHLHTNNTQNNTNNNRTTQIITTEQRKYKLMWNIFISVRIIKEMPGSVASGTICIFLVVTNTYYALRLHCLLH